MIKEILLPSDRFHDNVLTNLKQANFIYGKNGTGKSSITQLVKEQYSETYDIRVFQGFNSVVENTKLNAISLGTANSELQPQIDEVSEKIDKLKNELDNDIYEQYNKRKEEYDEYKKKLDNFYISSARNLKKKYTEITGPIYNKNDFKDDVPNAKKLEESNYINLIKLLDQKELKKIEKREFFNEDVALYLAKANEILQTKLIPSILIDFNSNDEKNWVKDGLAFHNGRDTCAFCGNKLDEHRITELNNYFNDNVKLFDSKIENTIRKMEKLRNELKNIKRIDSEHFYPKFEEEILRLNEKIVNSSEEYDNFLNEIILKLSERKKRLFDTMDKLDLIVPNSMEQINEEYFVLCNKNDQYTDNLVNEKNKASEDIRLHLVQEKLDEFGYLSFVNDGNKIESRYEVKKEQYDSKQSEKAKLEEDLKILQSKSISEEVAAEKINTELRNLGNQAFQLVLAEGDHKGQYRIKNMNGSLRDVDTLSTGEKNIIAFLWFIVDLDNPQKKTGKNRVIIFDDPMDSNDDTTQYLIMTKLRDLVDELKGTEDQVFILTHNIHFYINTRMDYWWYKSGSSNYKKTTYHLYKISEKTKIKTITKKDEDIDTTYKALWKELRYLFEQKKPQFMLNTARRIIETYTSFNNIDKNDFYSANKEAKMLFNVNSHSDKDIYDFYSDPNGKNEEEIKEIIEDLFRQNRAIKHFNVNWEKSK